MLKVSYALIAVGYAVLFYWASGSLYKAFMWSPSMWIAIGMIGLGAFLQWYSFYRESVRIREEQEARRKEMDAQRRPRRFHAY